VLKQTGARGFGDEVRPAPAAAGSELVQPTGPGRSACEIERRKAGVACQMQSHDAVIVVVLRTGGATVQTFSKHAVLVCGLLGYDLKHEHEVAFARN
jgi:hypothetical protein